jgi:hypothetical protein
MPYTFLDFGKDVLKDADRPMTYQEMWEKGVSEQLHEKVRISGKTPWQTLGARLYVDVRDNEESVFVKVGRNPAKFFLKSRLHELPKDIDKITTEEKPRPKKEKLTFEERELHPLVSYFAYANLTFNRGKSIYTKTIYHENPRKVVYPNGRTPTLSDFIYR